MRWSGAKLLKDHMNIFINFEEELEAASCRRRRQAEIRNENLTARSRSWSFPYAATTA